MFTPLFMRFWFLEYYEGFEVPEELGRVRGWREAYLAHSAVLGLTPRRYESGEVSRNGRISKR